MGVCIINLDEYESIGTHQIAFYVNAENVTNFHSFGVKHIPKKIKKFIRNKNIITSIYTIRVFDSIMCAYFYNGFIDFKLKGKSLLEYRNLFSTNEYEENDKTILKHLQQNLNMLKCIVIFAINIENYKKKN